MNAPQFGLRLAEVRIQDFKTLRDVLVPLNRTTTVLVGENNSGKTSFLEALDVAFGRRFARVQDLHSGLACKASSFVIDLRIEPYGGDEFHQKVVDVVGNAVQFGVQPDDPSFFTIRVTGEVNAEGWDITLSRTFMKGWARDRAGALALERITAPAVRREVLDLLHFDMLDARRDIVEQLRNRRTYWGRATSQVSIDEAVRAELEKSLKQLGQDLTTKSPVLTQLREDLTSLSEGLSSGKLSVELEALPRNVDDLIRAMDIVITSADSAPFSVENHGMGTRSLAALLVFRSYVNVVRPRKEAERLLSVAGFEEPEAHLHPQAQRAAFDILSEIGGQRIVSTHSPQVVSIADIDAYRVFRRLGAETRVSAITAAMSAPWDAEQVRRFVQIRNPDVLFAKAVGVVEGDTEAAAFPVLARTWWGARGADGRGVSLVHTGGAGSSKHIVPFLDALGIPWLIFCDGDKAGLEGLAATAKVIGRTLDGTSPEVVLLPGGHDFETYLLAQGLVVQASRAADRHPEGDLARYMKRNTGNKRADQSIRDYSGSDGRKIAALDFLQRYKGTVGALVAEEVVADIAMKDWPPAISDFFGRLDKACG